MPDRSRKRPKDPNQLAKFVVDVATGARDDQQASSEEQGKNPAAVALGRLGGLKGGAARAASLSKQKRVKIARRAAEARWRSGGVKGDGN